MSLLDRIAEREAALCEEADRLRKQLREVEGELERITVTRQVVTQLLDQDPRLDPGNVGGVRYTVAARAAVRARVPHRDEADGAGELPEDYQRILAIVADTVAEAGAPVQAKTVCQALEDTAEPARVETTRSKLKRLAERGWLYRNGAGMFTTTP